MKTLSLADLSEECATSEAARRDELMLRISEMEKIATGLGHAEIFVTLTCPSKYHATLSSSGTANPKYNNSTPRDAQAYLQSVWSRACAISRKNGVRPYGFRIVEPHKDGCPHWHMLLFVVQEHAETFTRIMRECALTEDRYEPGATIGRINIDRIDISKGAVAGYIAKYAGKNIDDVLIDPRQRAINWAAQWGIRQFQSIGALPIIALFKLQKSNERGAVKSC